MKEPGLDQRHRDKTPPKAGEIQQERSDTLNRNLSRPIPEFRSDAALGKMREETGKVSEEAVFEELPESYGPIRAEVFGRNRSIATYKP
jgi:hypothetical protein